MSTLEQIMAAMERGVTAPVAARAMAERWSKTKTARTYLVEIRQAREWWTGWREAARRAAEQAGLERIPEGDAAQFMPWSPDRLQLYVGHLAQSGRAPGTIHKALSALRAWHRLHGMPIPDSTAALTVVQDHERNLRSAGWTERRADPISLDVAVRLLAACDRGEMRGRRDAAVLMLCFGGMLPAAGLAALDMADIRPDPDGNGLLVRRKPLREDTSAPAVPGTDADQWLLISHWRISGEHAATLCPVEAVHAWLNDLADLGAPRLSPVFRPIDRHGNVAGIAEKRAGGVDRVAEDGRMDPSHIGNLLRQAADRAGLDPDERPTMTGLRLGGVVRRRLDGATVDELTHDAGLKTLLEYVAIAERRQASL